LRECKPFVEEGVHPQVIIRSFRLACSTAIQELKKIAVTLDKNDPEKLRELLQKCASTTLNSKASLGGHGTNGQLVSHQKGFFSKLVVDAVMMLGEHLPLNMIGMKKVQGGSLEVCI
jgi:T-complex protein 1 subunit eta